MEKLNTLTSFIFRSMSALDTVLHFQGKGKEATEVRKAVLHLQRGVLGRAHPYTHASMNKLAILLQEQGQWQEAEEMHRQALEVQRRVLGQEHPNTLLIMSNFANVLQVQGRWQEAEDMHREALEAKHRVLGQEHPNTLASMNNLAIVLQEQGQWQEAEQMHREVLEVRRRVLGREHPDTLGSMHGLASVLRDQNKWQEAEEMQREVLELMCRVLGPAHPWTWDCMSDTAQVLVMRDRDDWAYRFQILDKDKHQDRFKVAVKHLRSAIAALQKASKTEDHPDLLSYRAYLAKVLVQANEESTLLEAEGLLQLVIPGLSKRFGVEHARTQPSIATLVSLLEEQGRDEDAEQWRQHLFEAQGDGDDVRALPTGDLELDIPEVGSEHPDGEIASLLRGLLGFGTCRYAKVVSSDGTSSAPFRTNKGPEAERTSLCDASQLSSGQSDSSCAGYSLESFDSSHASSAFLQAARPVLQRRMRREREGRRGT